ncbi:methenyltetrahydromethanopterin cyclohydrolase [Hyphomicrobium sp.]|uniref:methenyltetrahydromethanopterin cyclohydrolase n=1 Tax=Hyphomicrobium sp. TaxID=82 RepID=UPI002D773E68|nr:methenyltetrahydromethanopterin cyclohydrolase [Hyphomicrobium sp.]HET6387900.1 methenyltetrahydromethanopterin cyclohydrolase [Hyphomicrobium sp.]
MVKQPSVSAGAAKIVDDIVANADALRISVTKGSLGERLIDMGAEVVGGLEAGRLLGEVCMGGLGTVAFTQSSGLPNWPLGVVVSSNNPVIACLGSQYAGWTITDESSGFFALGSGPARALSRVEDLYKELGYADHSQQATLVIEGDKAPPSTVIAKLATACGVDPTGLTVIYATTWSLAGTVQIAARVLEVAIHKAHALHFPLENILDGTGTTAIAPPVPDFVKAMGRTNDAIIYGGRIHLFVKGPDSDAERLAKNLPSSTCSVYGKPFAEIFADVQGDFYKIDPMLFSPAQVIVSNVETGNSFRAGELAPEIVDASFS